MRVEKIKWKTEALDGLPPISKSHKLKGVQHSVRVLVRWRWRNSSSNNKVRELRFAHYYHNSKAWVIEGIMGDVEVIEWARIKNRATINHK